MLVDGRHSIQLAVPDVPGRFYAGGAKGAVGDEASPPEITVNQEAGSDPSPIPDGSSTDKLEGLRVGSVEETVPDHGMILDDSSLHHENSRIYPASTGFIERGDLLKVTSQITGLYVCEVAKGLDAVEGGFGDVRDHEPCFVEQLELGRGCWSRSHGCAFQG